MAASSRILIVDDDQNVVEALCTALAGSYEVLSFHTGSPALEFLAKQTVDLVLLDYLLPDVSGLTLLRAIKNLSPSVLVILMTGFGSEDVSVESFRGGARDYVRKPFKLPDLLARIQLLLGARQRCTEPRAPVLLEAAPSPASAPTHGPQTPNIQRAIAFIEEHLDAPLTLGQVSREAGMSKFHFCRVFKATTGVTFREYLGRCRVRRAAELLRDKNRSVTEVSLEVGFQDMTHFGRVFRKLTGHLPSLYRRIATASPPWVIPFTAQNL